jgi:thiamine pyrophosphokinase
MGRCVIVGGAAIERYDEVKSYLRSDNFYIFCDSGLRHLEGLGVQPSLIIGDFDSHENPHLPIETITLPREKDDTDTVFAVKEALKRGFEDFLLIGAVGARFDHSMGNVSILLYLDTLGKKALLVDDYSEMEIVSRGVCRVGPEFPYFSLVNISGVAKGVRVENAKFPLDDAVISCEYQYGISNEPLVGKTAVISVDEGRLLLVRVRRG